jgi:iron(III) transport system substrate-binding protein
MKTHANLRRKTTTGLLAASALAVAIAAAPSSPAAAEDWSDVVKKAEQEGSVILYIATPPAVTDRVIDAFQKKYPNIKAAYVRDSASVLVTRFQSELETTGKPPADVVEGATFSSLTNNHPDWFIPLDSASSDFIPSLADYPANALSSNSVVSAAYNWSLGYNTNQLKSEDLPKEWKDLADPKWKGMGMMVDPRQSPSYLSWYVFERKELGDDFLRGLAANDFVLSNGGGPTAQALAAGQVAFGFPIARSHSADVRANGAPVAHADLTPFQVNTTIQAYPVNAAHPNAARVLANFMLSPEAQEIYCQYGGLSSFSNKAAGACTAIKMPSDVSKADLDVSDEERDEVVKIMGLQ